MADENVAVAVDPSEAAGNQNNSTTLEALGDNIEAIITPDTTPPQGTSDSTPTPTESVIPQAQPIPAQPATITDAVVQTVTDPSQAQTPSTEPAAEPATVDDGLAERLRQDNAGMQKVLDLMGIDADKREYLSKGLMTADDILKGLTAHTQAIQPAATPVETAQSTETQIPLSQRLSNLKTAISGKTGDVEPDEYRSQMSEALGVIESLATELDSQKKDNEQIKVDNQQADLVNWQKGNMAIVHGAVEKAEFYAGMEPEIQTRIKSLVMGSVNEGVSALANHSDATVRAKALSPEAFAYVAQQTITDFAKILGVSHKAGSAAAVGNIQANPKTVNPISAGDGTNVVQKPQPNFTLESLEANTKAFLEAAQATV